MMADCLERPARRARPAPPAATRAGRLLTPRLLLDRPHVGDAVALSEALADREVARMLVDLPQPFLPGDALDWILAVLSGETDEQPSILRLHAETAGLAAGRAAGCVSLTGTEDCAVLSYWLARPLWNRGLTGEAVRAVLARHFAENPATIVRSGVMADNAASLRLQERLGFAITGVRDVYSQPRGRMVHLIETELTAHAFNPA